jgi:hypothetical protein
MPWPPLSQAGDPALPMLAFVGSVVDTGTSPSPRAVVPTLFRFLFVLAVLAGLAFAAMFALATFVEPQPREMSVTIPNSRLPAR